MTTAEIVTCLAVWLVLSTALCLAFGAFFGDGD